MYALMISGRVVSDLSFYRYKNRDYCIVSLECDKYITTITEPIPCIIPCDDVETMKQYLHKGDYICGDGRVETRRDYKGNIKVHIVFDNVARYLIRERGEHHEKDRL